MLREPSGSPLGAADLEECLALEVAKPGESLDSPGVKVGPESNLMVIYTSGTTGLPKGINNNHFKLLVIGLTVSRNLGLGPDDVGYACMPLFHSNAMFLGFQPAFQVGGTLAMRERFSASSFVPDVLRYGVSYWNYVGRARPLHPGCDREGVRRATKRASCARSRRIRATGCATPSATAPPRPTSTASCAGSGSRTCSSSTARPRRRSARFARRRTRAAASARSRTRT